MAGRKVLFAAYVSEEEADMIRHLFDHNNLELQKVEIEQRGQNIEQGDDLAAVVGEDLQARARQAEHDECPYCFASPCVASGDNRQFRWPEECTPQNETNNKARKKLYKSFLEHDVEYELVY